MTSQNWIIENQGPRETREWSYDPPDPIEDNAQQWAESIGEHLHEAGYLVTIASEPGANVLDVVVHTTEHAGGESTGVAALLTTSTRDEPPTYDVTTYDGTRDYLAITNRSLDDVGHRKEGVLAHIPNVAARDVVQSVIDHVDDRPSPPDTTPQPTPSAVQESTRSFPPRAGNIPATGVPAENTSTQDNTAAARAVREANLSFPSAPRGGRPANTAATNPSPSAATMPHRTAEARRHRTEGYER